MVFASFKTPARQISECLVQSSSETFLLAADGNRCRYTQQGIVQKSPKLDVSIRSLPSEEQEQNDCGIQRGWRTPGE